MDKLEKIPDSQDAENREKEYIQERERVTRELQSIREKTPKEMYAALSWGNNDVHRYETNREKKKRTEIINKILSYVREVKNTSSKKIN